MPTVTPETALLKAAEDLKTAIKCNNPQSLQTKEGGNQLTKISRGYTTKPTDQSAKIDTVTEEAAAQRASSDTKTTANAAPEQRVHTSVAPP